MLGRKNTIYIVVEIAISDEIIILMHVVVIQIVVPSNEMELDFLVLLNIKGFFM